MWTSRNNWSVIMREIQASEAKTHLPQLLDEIERGESIIITRHGRAIARLIPEDVMRRDGQAEAVERLKALRATMPRVPLNELMAMRHEGHRH
jgi:prevent-host-death family protein